MNRSKWGITSWRKYKESSRTLFWVIRWVYCMSEFFCVFEILFIWTYRGFGSLTRLAFWDKISKAADRIMSHGLARIAPMKIRSCDQLVSWMTANCLDNFLQGIGCSCFFTIDLNNMMGFWRVTPSPELKFFSWIRAVSI